MHNIRLYNLTIKHKTSTPHCFDCLRVFFRKYIKSTFSSSSVMIEALIDLFRLSLIVSSKVFKVFLVHLVCNSALFLHLLLRVICRSQFDLYLCIFVVSRQLFPLSSFPNFLHAFCGQKELFFRKISSRLMSVVVLSFFFFLGSKFRFHIKERGAPVHYVLLFLKISEPKFV
jgi:hypothetical protein